MAIKLEVWGDYANFTRPEFKTERLSYEVMTPSAARGILESIYWHPGIKYVIDKIHVCAPIKFTNIRANETGEKISAVAAKRAFLNNAPQYIDTKATIQQRSSTLLRDVRYVIEAHIVLTPEVHEGENLGKFYGIFTRRAEWGQCYTQPCFGMREYPAFFKLCEKIPPCPKELIGTRNLGVMLWDFDYSDPQKPTPRCFRAKLVDGVMVVPSNPDNKLTPSNGDDPTILGALVQLQDALIKRGDLEGIGWFPTKLSYALDLDMEGKLIGVSSIMEEVDVGKKNPNIKLLPKAYTVPAPVKRGRNIKANFLWDNATYLLGLDVKENPEHSLASFVEARNFHQSLLNRVDTPAAKAICRFFNNWEPYLAAQHPLLQACMGDLQKGCNLTFRVSGNFAHEDPKIRDVWSAWYENAKGERGQCSITGQQDIIPAVHPAIKGVRDAQATGAALVSYNAPAFCSRESLQSLNSSVGYKAATAYTSAINYLLAQKKDVHIVSNMTILSWAAGADPMFTKLFNFALYGDDAPEGVSPKEASRTVDELAAGKRSSGLDPNTTFYVLGISPNAARLAVKLFIHDSFGNIIRNIKAHNDRIAAYLPKPMEPTYGPAVPLFWLLNETVNPFLKKKIPSSQLSVSLLRAILTGAPYPKMLLDELLLRIYKEQYIGIRRLAIIKAYLEKNAEHDCRGEQRPVLKDSEKQQAILLGRLFRVYERTQLAAVPGIGDQSIKATHFSKCSTIPATGFKWLHKKNQQYLDKLWSAKRFALSRSLANDAWDLREKIDTIAAEYPQQHTQLQRVYFLLGYEIEREVNLPNKNEEVVDNVETY